MAGLGSEAREGWMDGRMDRSEEGGWRKGGRAGASASDDEDVILNNRMS